MKTHIKNNVSWIGKTDWELRNFHGYEYSTHKGSSYNSYLIEEEKTVIIDTVWLPFAKEYVANLKGEINLAKVDFVVANHGEIDHSGALPELMKELKPGTPVYCTANGVKSLTGHYHEDWNFKPVKTGDKVSLGKKELLFVEAPMLHWPDTMMTYLTGDNVLFSNDAFGQHYATDFHFNDSVDQSELFVEALKYYANILTPFSHLVEKKIKEFLSLHLPLEVICPSHGVIWRKDPVQIIEKYLEWAAQKPRNQITLIYDTMWNGTRRMAEAIARGIESADKTTEVKLFNTATTDKNDVIAEVFKSRMIGAGSPTINKGILSSMAAILEVIRGLGFKNKKAFAFGAYGWSGESVKMLEEELKECGFALAGPGLKSYWNPDGKALQECFEFGQRIAKA
jgi:flavorubredoxin